MSEVLPRQITSPVRVVMNGDVKYLEDVHGDLYQAAFHMHI
jgi:hypothetical protein